MAELIDILNQILVQKRFVLIVKKFAGDMLLVSGYQIEALRTTQYRELTARGRC